MLDPDFVITQLWRPPVPLSHRPGYYLAVGPRETSSWALRALCPALAEGGQVYWVDAANRFDAYGLSRTAQALHISPRVVLARVQLARPFTAFQLEALVSSKIPNLSAAFPVILSDPLALFYDNELPQEDAPKVFQKFLIGLQNLPMPVLALAVQREPPEGRRHFSKLLAGSAKATAYLDIEHGPWQLDTVRLGGKLLKSEK